MLILSIIFLLLSNAVTLRRDKSILYSRVAIIVLLYSSIIAINSLFISSLAKGIGLYGGLFHATAITQNFHIFIFIISAIIIQLTAFYPRRVLLDLYSSLSFIGKLKLQYKKSLLIDKDGEQFKIIEYPLILLFIVSGAVFLISTSDLVSIFLSIELQSYGLYLLSTIYRNSELATNGGITYFLLGGLSSCFILFGISLIYANSGTTNLDGLYIITSLSDLSNGLTNNVSSIDKSDYINYSLLILSVGFLFKISAAPFHFWSPLVYDAIPTIVTTFVAIIAKISILIFLLELVHYTSNSLFNYKYTWTTSLLVSSFISLIIGSILGLREKRIKRLLAYSTIVRRCVVCGLGFLKSMYCPIVHTVTRLGRRESRRLNLASLCKGRIRSNQADRLVSRTVLPMIKTALFEIHLWGSSSIGTWFACDRSSETNSVVKWLTELWTVFTQNAISIIKVDSGWSKGSVWPYVRTSGSPKVGNNYGDRGIVVPNLFGRYHQMNGSIWGRIPSWNIRCLSSAAGRSGTVESDSARKLLKLAEYCRKNPGAYIADPLYKMMFDPKLYELAYSKIKSKPGNMTKGIVATTLDGMSGEVIDGIIAKLKDNSFRFSAARRVEIPKPNGKKRPLTIAPPRDKLVQEVMRLILEAIFEPTFSPNSHGFRPGKSCHSALKSIFQEFGVATWYIEGDISQCFPSIDHDILMRILEGRIKDQRFLRLIRKALKAGYFELKTYKHSVVGTPQGSIISPILANILLDKLDSFVLQLKQGFDRGNKPKINSVWSRYQNKKMRAKDLQTKLKVHKLLLSVPSRDPLDSSFKKLVYVRYADDWLIGIRGSKEDATSILDQIRNFLASELKLELSLDKTVITNAKSEKALFLGTRIGRARHTSFSRGKDGNLKRNGKIIRLEAPLERIKKKLKETNFMESNLPAPRFLWLHNNKDEIIILYNAVYRGFINYYRFVSNFGSISAWLHYTLKSSCAKLLAAKFSLGSQRKVFVKFGSNLKGSDKVSFVKAEYKLSTWSFKFKQVDLIQSLYTQSLSAASLYGLACSACGSDYRVEMHHVRILKDLNPKLSKIDQLMVRTRRKQIALCRECHLLHHGQLR